MKLLTSARHCTIIPDRKRALFEPFDSPKTLHFGDCPKIESLSVPSRPTDVTHLPLVCGGPGTHGVSSVVLRPIWAWIGPAGQPAGHARTPDPESSGSPRIADSRRE